MNVDPEECDSSPTQSTDDDSSIKYRFENVVSRITSSGSFATFAQSAALVLPGLLIQGFGNVETPISSEQARLLFNHGRQAPFGKGNETLFDTSIRQTQEIDGADIQFQNEDWSNWLNGVVSSAASALGVPAAADTVHAELHKMLIYNEDCHFKAHRDSEKVPGMFGTLVICLPSKHEGGAVRLSHAGKEMVFESDQGSAYRISYMAWYADVTHEIQPVRSGYRIVLTFNLTCPPSTKLASASAKQALRAGIVDTLRDWHNLDVRPGCLCYALEHLYTQKALQLSILKGNDHHRVCATLDACQESNNFMVLLAHLERCVTQPNDEGGEDYCEEQLTLRNIVDTNGFMLQIGLNIPSSFLVQESLYEDRDPDEQAGGEHLGNQHADLEFTYKDTDNAVRFLLGRDHKLADYNWFLQRLQHGLTTGNTNTLVPELFRQACSLYIDHPSADPKTTGFFLGYALTASCGAGDYTLAQQVLSATSAGFDIDTFARLGRLYSTNSSLVELRNVIDSAFLRVSTLHDFQARISAFCNKIKPTGDQLTAEDYGSELWKRKMFQGQLQRVKIVDKEDGKALVELCACCRDEDLDTWVRSFVMSFREEASFINRLVIAALTNIRHPKPGSQIPTKLLALVLEKVVLHFSLSDYSTLSEASDKINLSTRRAQSDQDEVYIICALCRHLRDYKSNEAERLLDAIESQLSMIPDVALDRFILPLVQQMITGSNTEALSESSFCQSMLDALIARYVQREPEIPSDWARPDEAKEAKCWKSSCTECSTLQEFLRDPASQFRIFQLDDSYCHLRFQVPSKCDSKLEGKDLKVTKTLRGYEAKHTEWQKRVSLVTQGLKKLPSEPLVKLLGSRYKEIMNLDSVRLLESSGVESPRKRKRQEEPLDEDMETLP